MGPLASLPQQALRGFARQVSLLYAAAEEASFLVVLRQFLADLVAFDDLTIFCQRDGEHPQLIWASFETDVIRTGVRNYLESTYIVDPFVRVFRRGAPAGAYRAIDVARHVGLSRCDRRNLRLEVRSAEELGFLTEAWPENMAELQIVFSLDALDKGRTCCQIGLYRDPDRPTFSKEESQLLTSITALIEGAFSLYWSRLKQPEAASADPACLQLLSPRERDVIELVLQGFTSAAISDLLQVSLETVKTHRKRAYRKLEISSQAELFAIMQPAPTAIRYHT